MNIDHRARRDRLRGVLSEEELDALYVSRLTNVRWLTGFTGSHGAVVVGRDPELDLLLTDGRYDTQAASEVPDVERVIVRGGHEDEVVARLTAGDRLGFEADQLDWRAGERLCQTARQAEVEPRPITGIVERRRAVKDPGELRALRQACELTVVAFTHLLAVLRPGLSEREAATAVERAMVDAGAEGPAFATIVASGPNGARPHHRPTDRRIQRGDLVTVDLGARFAGYHADMTRTVSVGEPPAELRAVHDLVRRAQETGVEAARAGTPVGDVDAASRDLITRAGHGEHFVHPTGHGVGLDIHEWPTLAAEGRATLEEGMTVTVEPGVYLAQVGGVRIEDTIAVTAAGPPETLTTAPRELIIV